MYDSKSGNKTERSRTNFLMVFGGSQALLKIAYYSYRG